jgi:hypothetical protein
MVREEYRWRAFEQKHKMGSRLACMGGNGDKKLEE